MAQIRCTRCRNLLGEQCAGIAILRHKGREAVVSGLLRLKCEQCGHEWHAPRQPEPTEPARDVAVK